MKKYLILTAITTALIFTACGNTQTAPQENVPSDTSATTLNSATEMTIPASESDDTAAEQTVQATERETTAVQTTETSVENETDEFPVYDAKVISVTEKYISVELLTDSFFGSIGDEAYIMGKFNADIGDTVEISFLSDEVGINESYPPEVYSSNTQVIVLEYDGNSDLPNVSREDVIEYEYSAKVISVGNNSVTITMLEDTFFCKCGEKVRLAGNHSVSADELILLVISDDAAVDTSVEDSIWQIDSSGAAIKKTSDNSEAYHAEITAVNPKSITVEMMTDSFFGSKGDEVILRGSYDFSEGEEIVFTISGETEILDSYPPEIIAEHIDVRSASETVSSAAYISKVTSVSDRSVTVTLLEDTPFCRSGDEAVISGLYYTEVGDYAFFKYDESAAIKGEPPKIGVESVLGFSPLSTDNILAEVTDVDESRKGGYSLTVKAYGVLGYYSPVPISIHSDIKPEVGRWIEIDFAEDTIFMETSPLQVSDEYVLKITELEF